MVYDISMSPRTPPKDVNAYLAVLPVKSRSALQNLRKQIKTDATGTTTYAWDYENRLVSVTLPNTSVVSFTYDPFGRRVGKVSGSTTTIFVYDGAGIVEEVDATGTVVARYVQGPNIDEPLAMVRGGAKHYYQSDGLGSITSLTDSSGAVAASYVFDAFGNQTAATGSLTNTFRYTAREADTDTGLYYYRARYYDQNAGRFLTEDPLFFAGGNLNLYTPVWNNPINFIDPFGESPKDVVRIRNAFRKAVDEMTQQGLRHPNPWWNNFRESMARLFGGNKYMGCIEQAEDIRDVLQRGTYDDAWTFSVEDLGLHKRVRAFSKNPKDPQLILDPWYDEIQERGPERKCNCPRSLLF